MKKYIYNNVLTLASGAMLLSLAGSLSSCRDQNFDFDEHRFGTTVEQVYNKTFTDTFGEVDPNHTWMPFVDASITAGVDGNYQVFADSKLVGEYMNVTAGEKLTFSVDYSISEVMVVCNHFGQMVKLGETYTKPETRSTIGNGRYVIETNTGEFKTLESSEVTAWNNEGKLKENSDNRGNVTKNFEFVSTGECMIYPIYWYTDAHLYVGLYYYDENGQIVELDPFFNIAGRGDNSNVSGVFTENGKEKAEPLKNNSKPSTNRKYLKYKTEGIKITLPVGTVFGLYCYQTLPNKVNNGSGGPYRYYSSSSFNNGSGTDNHCPTANSSCNGAHAGIYKDSNGITYLGMEDWDSDFDLNDIMFMMEPCPPIIDEDKDPFVLAFEDMGSIGDFDFNDVVLLATPGNTVDGEQHGTLTLSAAGATYEIEVMYDADGDGIWSDSEVVTWPGSKTEVHDAFGVEKETMVNTGLCQKSSPIINNFNFKVESKVEIAKRFCLKVTTKQEEDGQEAVYRYIQIPNKTEGMAPQGFVVNYGKWAWPAERQNITDKYPKFESWVRNHLNTSWYQVLSTNGDFTE